MRGNAMRQTRKWNIIGILLLIIILAVGGTLAYFSDDDQVRTIFATGEYDSIKVQLIEPEWKSEDQGLDSLPGDNIPADPTIVNLEQDVYMRVKLYLTDRITGEVITGTRAQKIGSMIHYADTAAEWAATESPMTEAEAQAKLPMQFNEQEFVYDDVYSDIDAGIYCFNYIGVDDTYIFRTDERAVLYTHVIVPSDWTEADLAEVGTFKVNIIGQAVHTDNYEEPGEQPITSPAQAFKLIHELVDKTG